MGIFMTNLKREIGKKSGKAIGNALYGKHADDLRMTKRVSWNNERHTSSASNANQSVIDYESIEKAKRKTLEHEHELSMLNSIIQIEFDVKDKYAIVKELTFLSSCIDLWLKTPNKNLRAAKSKFETGLALLNAVD